MKQKLNIQFHNPNTNETTIKYISLLLAEVAVSKVLKAQKMILSTPNTKLDSV